MHSDLSLALRVLFECFSEFHQSGAGSLCEFSRTWLEPNRCTRLKDFNRYRSLGGGALTSRRTLFQCVLRWVRFEGKQAT